MEYTVKMVCAHLGIKPDTLRKWESRHRLVKPKRGPNGYRLYSESDLKQIFQFVKLRRDPLQGNSPGLPSIDSKNMWEVPPSLAADVEEAVMTLNRSKLETIIMDLHQRRDVVFSFNSIWAPILQDLGEKAMLERGLWIAREHFAVGMLRDFLLREYSQHIPPGSPQIILAAPEREMHELGMLVALTALTLRNISALYLGPNLPTESLLSAIKKTGVSRISLTLTTPMTRPKFKRLIMDLFSSHPNLQIFIAGQGSLPLANLITQSGAEFLGTDLEIALSKIEATINNT